MNWQSDAIPSTIRRPWKIFQEYVEDDELEAGSLGIEVSGSVRERAALMQAQGAQAAFATLAPGEQETFVAVSVLELAAYVNWRSHQGGLAFQDGSTFEDVWDNADCDDKRDWIVDNPADFLVAHGWHLPRHLALATTRSIIAEQDLEYEETLKFMEKQSTRN